MLESYLCRYMNNQRVFNGTKKPSIMFLCYTIHIKICNVEDKLDPMKCCCSATPVSRHLLNRFKINLRRC